MKGNEYQEQAARTLVDGQGRELSGQNYMIVWNAIGLSGEAGEVSELVKKGIFHEHGLDMEKLKKEIGDVLWYAAGLCTVCNINFEDVMNQNIEKLKARYPDGFSSERSISRIENQNT